MEGSALSLARQMAGCWNSGDLDRVFAMFDPDVVVRPDPGFPEARTMTDPYTLKALTKIEDSAESVRRSRTFLAFGPRLKGDGEIIQEWWTD